MAYDGWLNFNDVELVNISRTAQLAQALGIDTVWTDPESVAWIETELSGSLYNHIEQAPWYDAGYPASSEFAGIIPLSLEGLGDSTLTASVTEYITDGGHSGGTRNAALNVVANVALVASTDRGAEFGLRWMNRVLRGGGGRTFCTGSDLTYFRYGSAGAPKAHRRDVRVTRGSSVTRKRVTDCSSTWLVTFTLTAGDPYEYGDEVEILTDLGGAVVGASTSGTAPLVQETCPVYDYSPIYDPLYPALVAAPEVPDFYPTGWTITSGDPFNRYWARVDALEPSSLNVVPVIRLRTETEARMIRVSIWPADSVFSDQCDPLFSAVVTYLLAAVDFMIDGEQKASYVWDGFSAAVRRTDSLVYGPDAQPVEWAAFSDPAGLLVTLDVFKDDAGVEQGAGTVRVDLSLMPKSD